MTTFAYVISFLLVSLCVLTFLSQVCNFFEALLSHASLVPSSRRKQERRLQKQYPLYTHK